MGWEAPRVERAWLNWASLAAVALALRLATVWVLGAWEPSARPLAYEHGAIAQNLLAGQGFSITYLGTFGPTSQQAPLYPFALAGLYWLTGGETPAALVTMQFLQCFAGTGIVLALVWLCRSLMPDKPLRAWLAGWVAAVYPTHVYMVTHIQVVVWATLLLVLMLAVAVAPRSAAQSNGPRRIGLLAGLLLLVDPILVLAIPVAALAYWQQVARLEARLWTWRAAQGCFRIACWTALVISPWLVRNYVVHNEFVFIKDTFGYAFWQGNNPHSWGTDKIPKATVPAILAAHDGSLVGMQQALWEARHETLYIDDVLLRPSGYAEFRGLSEPARSRVLQAKALAFIAERPDQYLRLCGQRLRYFLFFDETNPKTANLLYRGANVLGLGLALLGMWLAGVDRGRGWPTLAVLVAITGFHTLTICAARFRIPVEPLSFLWVACALEPLVRSLALWRESFPREGSSVRPASADSAARPSVRPRTPRAARTLSR